MAKDKENTNLPKGFRNIPKVLAVGLVTAVSYIRYEELETEYHEKPAPEISQTYERGNDLGDLDSFLESDVESNAGPDAEHIYATENIRGTKQYRIAREALQHPYAESNNPGTPACTSDVHKEIESLEAELTEHLNSNDDSGRTVEIAKKLFAYKLAIEDAEKEESPEKKRENYAGVFKLLETDENGRQHKKGD
ncbi:hypothetical protein GF343_01355 [Candidatus Woesearchaeota archaeon]|nr:hypothetical protein [Candidatus Woesearchaeota archaeon]